MIRYFKVEGQVMSRCGGERGELGRGLEPLGKGLKPFAFAELCHASSPFLGQGVVWGLSW